MRLTGNLKKQADNAADIAEKKKAIEKAGMKLSDDALDTVSGGKFFVSGNVGSSGQCKCCPRAFTSACIDCKNSSNSENEVIRSIQA